jgi:hypothetical protein
MILSSLSNAETPPPACRLEFPQLLVDQLGDRNEDRRPNQAMPVFWLLALGDDVRQQVLGVQDPDDVVERLLIDRQP